MKYEKEATLFIEVIKTLSQKQENLENLESYLSRHFKTWLKRYANTPDGIIYELKAFADM
jgi:hypothetical protein